MSPDHAPQRFGFLQRQVVLSAAPGAGQMDVLDLVRAVVLGPSLQVGVADHADRLEEGQGSVDRGRVDGGEPALDPPGDVERRDVPLGAEDLLEDDLSLGCDPVAALPEHGGHGPGLVHGTQRIGRCNRIAGAARGQGWCGLPPKVPSAGDRLMMPAGR
jgi:hypothetical protein